MVCRPDNGIVTAAIRVFVAANRLQDSDLVVGAMAEFRVDPLVAVGMASI
jgi:hypothetical protein